MDGCGGGVTEPRYLLFPDTSQLSVVYPGLNRVLRFHPSPDNLRFRDVRSEGYTEWGLIDDKECRVRMGYGVFFMV